MFRLNILLFWSHQLHWRKKKIGTRTLFFVRILTRILTQISDPQLLSHVMLATYLTLLRGRAMTQTLSSYVCP